MEYTTKSIRPPVAAKKTLFVLVVMLISCSDAQLKLSRKKNLIAMCMF